MGNRRNPCSEIAYKEFKPRQAGMGRDRPRYRSEIAYKEFKQDPNIHPLNGVVVQRLPIRNSNPNIIWHGISASIGPEIAYKEFKLPN